MSNVGDSVTKVGYVHWFKFNLIHEAEIQSDPSDASEAGVEEMLENNTFFKVVISDTQDGLVNPVCFRIMRTDKVPFLWPDEEQESPSIQKNHISSEMIDLIKDAFWKKAEIKVVGKIRRLIFATLMFQELFESNLYADIISVEIPPYGPYFMLEHTTPFRLAKRELNVITEGRVPKSRKSTNKKQRKKATKT